ncbi:ABC transporter permease [Aquihabitans sp. McL0605]|uniref:ABC transporter permease n=1 Tax=Aquihabitans sp. McL0605 TaxID=3415671 RepID=UPI003CFB7A6B
MILSLPARIALRLLTALVLAFLYVPLIVIAILSFSTSRTFTWPPPGYTTKWWHRAFHAPGPRDALLTSVKVALLATLIALVLGSLASYAVNRFKFFGRDSISLLIVLPIALPGIVTGVALNAAFREMGFDFGYITVVIAHATFCIVVVFNNVVARLRRLAPNVDEASADLGADVFQTFRYVTFPLIRSALVAGGLLAFALSFDEIVVTTFTAGPGMETLPQWIFNNIFRPNQLPTVNVVAVVVITLSIIPVWVAQRLSADPVALRSEAG